MPKLLFLSRVALICNVCFLLSLVLQLIPEADNGIISSTIIILGVVLSIVVNIVVTVFSLFFILTKRRLTDGLPGWIISINFLFFTFQIIHLIK